MALQLMMFAGELTDQQGAMAKDLEKRLTFDK